MNMLVTHLDRWLRHTLSGLMALLVVNVLWQVASRYLLNSASSYTEEIAQFLLIWIGLLGAAYAFGQSSHLGLDLLTTKLHGNAKKAVSAIALTVVVGFAMFGMIYGGGKLVLLILELRQTSAALRIPMGYVYLAIPFSGALIALYGINMLTQSLTEQQENNRDLP